MKHNALKSLRSAFDSALRDAQRVASQILLPLLSYARVLAPKILYEGREEDPLFPHQFRPFFTPSAIRAQWVRIHCVILLLLGFTSLCHRLLDEQSPWEEGEPVELLVNTNLASEKERQLLQVYQYLRVPIEGNVPASDLQGYTLEDAQNALLGLQKGKEVPIVSFNAPPNDLLGTDNDGLIWYECNPDYDEAEFEPDGQRKTALMRREDAEQKKEDEMGDSSDSDDDSDGEDGPSPEGGQQRVAMQQELPRVPILPDRPRAMQGMAAMAEASAAFSHPVPNTLQVPGSGSYLGSRTPTLASTSTSVTTSSLSRTSASSTQQSSEAEISQQHVRHTDRSQNYKGESKYAQGKGEGRKRKRRKDKRCRELQPSSKLVSRQGYGAPAPYTPIKGSMRRKHENDNCFCKTPIRDDCVPPL
jgi:hypothetical protein